MNSRRRPAALTVRAARIADVPEIAALMKRIYPEEPPYTAGMIQGHIANFPEGQFCVEYEDRIVGYAASFRIDERAALSPHTWSEITGGGYAARHSPKGDWLYGMEVGVDPDFRRLRIGQRIYDARKRLCEDLDLKGIVFGGRLPGLARRIAEMGSPEAYLEAVQAKRIRDSVMSFQLRNGFEPIGVLKNYLPSDRPSLGHAVHMVWRNPYRTEETEGRAEDHRRDPATVRLATVQLQARAVTGFDDFMGTV
ncbi:MAG: GNAT family N-acetyltransferase, partial [bacterium]